VAGIYHPLYIVKLFFRIMPQASPADVGKKRAPSFKSPASKAPPAKKATVVLDESEDQELYQFLEREGLFSDEDTPSTSGTAKTRPISITNLNCNPKRKT
jgi:hypothetical protein